MLAQRKLADAFARGREDRIAERRGEWRNARLSDTCGRGVVLDKVNVRAPRSFGHPRDAVIVEVRLIDYPAGRGDLTGARQARAKHRCAFELGTRRFRIGDETRIDRGVHARNAKLAAALDLDFDYRRDVGEEASMDGDAHAGPMSHPAFAPAGFLGRQFDHATQPTGIASR